MFPFHNSAYFFGSWQSQNSSGMSSKVNRIKDIKEDFTSLQLLIYLIENKVVFPMGAASMNTDPPYAPPRHDLCTHTITQTLLSNEWLIILNILAFVECVILLVLLIVSFSFIFSFSEVSPVIIS